MLQPLLLARKPHSGPQAAIRLGRTLGCGPTSNGQRHGLRGGFQIPWKETASCGEASPPCYKEQSVAKAYRLGC